MSAVVSGGWAFSGQSICPSVDLCSGQSWPPRSPPLLLRIPGQKLTFTCLCFNSFCQKWKNKIDFFCPPFFFTWLWLSLEFPSTFCKEFESQTSSCLSVTNASFAAAVLAALEPKGSVRTFCTEQTTTTQTLSRNKALYCILDLNGTDGGFASWFHVKALTEWPWAAVMKWWPGFSGFKSHFKESVYRYIAISLLNMRRDFAPIYYVTSWGLGKTEWRGVVQQSIPVLWLQQAETAGVTPGCPAPLSYLYKCHIRLRNRLRPCRTRSIIPDHTWLRASPTLCGNSALLCRLRRPGNSRSHPGLTVRTSAPRRTAPRCICPGSSQRTWLRCPKPWHPAPGVRTARWWGAETSPDRSRQSPGRWWKAAVLWCWRSGKRQASASAPRDLTGVTCRSSCCAVISDEQLCFAHGWPSSVSSFRCCRPSCQSGPFLEIRLGSGINSTLPSRNWKRVELMSYFVWFVFVWVRTPPLRPPLKSDRHVPGFDPKIHAHDRIVLFALYVKRIKYSIYEERRNIYI